MAKRRMVSSTIWEDDWFGPLPFFEQTLWIGLWSKCADDQGRLLDNPIVIRAAIFPYKDVAIEAIEDALGTFCKAERIYRYEADGKRLVQTLHWWEHQPQQWAMPSTWEAPPGWIDHARYREENEVRTINWHGKYGNAADNANWGPPGESLPKASPKAETGAQLSDEVGPHIYVNAYAYDNDDVLVAAPAASPQAHHHPPDGEIEDPERAKVAQVWEQLNPRRQISDVDRQALADLCDEYSPNEVLTGLYACNEYGKPYLAYLRTVLRNRGDPNGRARASPSGNGQGDEYDLTKHWWYDRTTEKWARGDEAIGTRDGPPPPPEKWD